METETLEIFEEIEQALADKENLREERGVESPKGMRFKQKTKIEMGGEELPGRTRAWRTDDGREVWLNTGELAHHLNKRRNGQRIFTTIRPPAADNKPPIIKGLECAVCIQMEGYSSPFRSESNYEDHMEILHPREYQREVRVEEGVERRRQTDALIAVAERRGANGTTIDNETVTPSAPQFQCETCGKEAKSAFGLRAHQRTHA